MNFVVRIIDTSHDYLMRCRQAFDIVLDPERLADCTDISKGDLNPEALSFITPFQFRKRGIETRLVIGTTPPKAVDATLIRSITKAHHYREAIKQGQTTEEIAASENLTKRRILQVIDLAFLLLTLSDQSPMAISLLV